ncbi:MAG: reverse transcriptase domain-containing protein [Melioribacteraceae bacterium]|nr:reverse transcriptase domain-containing protein [Melioribacteraceae bacterium]
MNLYEYLNNNFTENNFLSFIENTRRRRIHRLDLYGILKPITNSFEKYRQSTLEKVLDGTYKLSPISLRYIPKRTTGYRKVGLLNFNDIFLDKLVFDFLKEKTGIEFKNFYELSVEVKRKTQGGYKNYFRFDIKNFFDSIDHSLMLDEINKFADDTLTKFIESFLKSPWIIPKTKFEITSVEIINSIGVPTGAATSQILSEIYMISFDKNLREKFLLDQTYFARYCDDICVLSKSEDKVNSIRSLVKHELGKRKMIPNESKIVYGNIKDGFNFLGYHHEIGKISVDKNTIKIIKRSLIKFYHQIYNYSCSYKGLTFIGMSKKINSYIRGFNPTWINDNSDISTDISKTYGLARHLSITDDIRQISRLSTWIKKLNKYYCYKICEDLIKPKIYIELESLTNWYFKYRKNSKKAMMDAYIKFKDRDLYSDFGIENFDEFPMVIYYDLFNLPYDKEFENDLRDENDYVNISGNTYIAMDDVYYDPELESWCPTPDDVFYKS